MFSGQAKHVTAEAVTRCMAMKRVTVEAVTRSLAESSDLSLCTSIDLHSLVYWLISLLVYWSLGLIGLIGLLVSCSLARSSASPLKRWRAVWP